MNWTSLLPLLHNGHGHVLHYAQAVEKAVRLNGWNFQALVPKNCEIDLPTGWHNVLPLYRHTDSRGRFLRLRSKNRLPSLLHNLRCYLSLLPKLSGIVFLESFTPIEFLAFALAIAIRRPSFTLWLLYRNSPQHMPKQGRLYRKFQRLIERRLCGSVVLFTDSELLQEQLQPFFQRPVTVLPIPHTCGPQLQGYEKKDFAWWPGGDPTRRYKGWKVVQRLATYAEGTLYLTHNAKTLLPQTSMHLHFVEPYLTPKAYWQLLHEAKFVLVPQNPDVYAASTSGIFTEAICAGTAVLVWDKTWMAHELRKWGLEALITDFGPHCLKTSYDTGRLRKMSEAYRRFHSVEQYATYLYQASKTG